MDKGSAEYKRKRNEYQKKFRESKKGKAVQLRYVNGAVYQEVLALHSSDECPPIVKYDAHKGRAKRRGVEWLFTFESWWAIWEPHWENRGRGSDEFHMCRFEDKGPYSPDNVRIDTAANNLKEMWEIRRSKDNG